MQKNFLFGLLLVAGMLLEGTCVSATVYNGVCGENLTWTLNSEDSTLVISGRGAMTDMQFGSESFRVQSKLTKYVVFPEGLTSINDNAFGGKWNNCENLQSVTLPDSVVYVGKKAFWNCAGIKEVRCGKGLKSIGDSAFYFCENIKHLEMSDSLESIGIAAFYEDTALQGTIVFPENLKYIGSNAFGVVRTKARNVTAIWQAKHCKHFRYQTGGWGAPLHHFSKIVFGEHVECVPDYLCYASYCDTIILPESVDSIGVYAFGSNRNLRHIEMPSSLTYIGENAFNLCDQLISLRIPEGISVIPKHFATECSALSELILPSTLDSIMEGTFSYCTSLTHITFPASTKFIGEYAFIACSNLQHINLPEGLQRVGKNAFRNCTSLDSVTIPESMTNIEEYTFAGCNALHALNMPNSIRKIATGAFQNCSLDTLILSSELNLIGVCAFLNQNKLTDIVIPDEVRQISSRAFENCTGLRKVLIGKKTATIESDAFKNDSALIEIRSRAAYPPLVVNETFTGVPDSTWLFVPVQSIEAYADDPVWGQFRMEKAEEIRYVSVDAAETTAEFTWPTDSAAATYRLDIYKGGDVFCKLTLSNRGQLLAINFSANGRRSPMSNAGSSQPNTLSFQVTGLDAASRYNYVLSAFDENGTPLHVYIGDFATLGYEGELQGGGDEVIPTPPVIPSNPEAKQSTGIVPSDQVQSTKIIMDGKLYLMYKGRMYDVRGNQIK